MSKKQPTITARIGKALWPHVNHSHNHVGYAAEITAADWLGVVKRMGETGITPKILNELLDCYDEGTK